MFEAVLSLTELQIKLGNDPPECGACLLLVDQRLTDRFRMPPEAVGDR